MFVKVRQQNEPFRMDIQHLSNGQIHEVFRQAEIKLKRNT
jgi:hypothetical protein